MGKIVRVLPWLQPDLPCGDAAFMLASWSILMSNIQRVASCQLTSVVTRDRQWAFYGPSQFPSRVQSPMRAASSVDRALVSGTKGRGFDPRVALQNEAMI